MITKPNETLNYVRPDEVAECWNNVPDSLYTFLWTLTNKYQHIDREDCGPYDVIGINSVIKFWNDFTEEQKIQLNQLAENN
jgi:hypothetical protein